ncbi:MAG: hypothetical protein AVDCRST_MAG66-1529, partial [uncultured Pseudonocardia sp.]
PSGPASRPPRRPVVRPGCWRSTTTASSCRRGGRTRAAGPTGGACCSRPSRPRRAATSWWWRAARSATTRPRSPSARRWTCGWCTTRGSGRAGRCRATTTGRASPGARSPPTPRTSARPRCAGSCCSTARASSAWAAGTPTPGRTRCSRPAPTSSRPCGAA